MNTVPCPASEDHAGQQRADGRHAGLQRARTRPRVVPTMPLGARLAVSGLRTGAYIVSPTAKMPNVVTNSAPARPGRCDARGEDQPRQRPDARRPRPAATAPSGGPSSRTTAICRAMMTTQLTAAASADGGLRHVAARSARRRAARSRTGRRSRARGSTVTTAVQRSAGVAQISRIAAPRRSARAGPAEGRASQVGAPRPAGQEQQAGEDEAHGRGGERRPHPVPPVEVDHVAGGERARRPCRAPAR